MVARLDTSEFVRKEIESIYWCMKQNVIPHAHGKELTAVLKALAAIIHQEKQVEVDEKLQELRLAIEALKHSNTDDGSN